MPHQRYIADVVHERDPVTGRLWYDLAVIVIPRQCGKTTYIEAKLTASSQAGLNRTLIYAAQNADRAREKILDELYDLRLAKHPFFGPRTKPRRSNGSANIRFLNTGSKIHVVPSNESAADGKTVDDGVLDEAFVYRDLSVVASIQPTMVARPDPQLTIVSTVGDGDDGLLQHYQDVGAAAVGDPTSRVAYFEWSAGDDADIDDPAVWRATIPALGHTIDEARIESYRRSMGDAAFARAFLCRRPTVAQSAAVDLDDWAAAAHTPDTDLPIAPPYVAAFHVHPSRQTAAVAVAGTLPDGCVGLVVDHRPLVGWIVDAVTAATARGAVDIVADRTAGAGGIIDRLAGAGLAVTELSAADVASMSGTLVDELAERRVAHQDQPALTAAVTGSRRRPLGDAFTWSQRDADVDLSPLCAATWALGRYRRLFPAGARIDRIV